MKLLEVIRQIKHEDTNKFCGTNFNSSARLELRLWTTKDTDCARKHLSLNFSNSFNLSKRELLKKPK